MKLALLACLVVLSACTSPAAAPATVAPEDVPGHVAPRVAPVPFLDPSGDRVRVLRDTTTDVVLALDSDTVRCSALGYSEEELKVSVPDLAWLAHFDHRSDPSETAPCMTAGACTSALSPGLFFDGGDATFAAVPLRIVLTESLSIDADARTCSRRLDENVTTTLDGHAFRASRSGDPSPVDYALCVELANIF